MLLLVLFLDLSSWCFFPNQIRSATTVYFVFHHASIYLHFLTIMHVFIMSIMIHFASILCSRSRSLIVCAVFGSTRLAIYFSLYFSAGRDAGASKGAGLCEK